jgi:hypothetical protein
MSMYKVNNLDLEEGEIYEPAVIDKTGFLPETMTTTTKNGITVTNWKENNGQSRSITYYSSMTKNDDISSPDIRFYDERMNDNDPNDHDNTYESNEME